MGYVYNKCEGSEQGKGSSLSFQIFMLRCSVCSASGLLSIGECTSCRVQGLQSARTGFRASQKVTDNPSNAWLAQQREAARETKFFAGRLLWWQRLLTGHRVGGISFFCFWKDVILSPSDEALTNMYDVYVHQSEIQTITIVLGNSV